MACVRWNESHRASRLPPILSSVASSSPPYRLLSSSRPPRSAPYESLFHSGSPLSSLPSTVPPFSCFLSSLNPPQPSFSFSPIRRDGGNCARYTHVLSRTCGSKVFARGGQYSPTTRTIPSHPGKRREERRADDGGDTILPSCRGRDIFSLSRDNLETGVALPGRESSEGERLGPG